VTPADLSTGHGACPVCGASYHDWEFDIDSIGRVVLNHTCDERALERKAELHHRYGNQAVTVLCLDCEQPFIGTKSSIRCPACRGNLTPEQRRAISRANLERGRRFKCSECGRPRTKRSDRCRFHQRQLQIRQGLQRRAS